MLGLADNPTMPTPGLLGFIAEILENTRCLVAALVQCLGQSQFFYQFLLQSVVSGKPKKEINIVVFTPDHQCFPTKSTVSANYYPGIRPGGTDTSDDTFDLFNRAGSGIVVGWPQPGAQQMFPAKNVQRQIVLLRHIVSF